MVYVVLTSPSPRLVVEDLVVALLCCCLGLQPSHLWLSCCLCILVSPCWPWLLVPVLAVGLVASPPFPSSSSAHCPLSSVLMLSLMPSSCHLQACHLHPSATPASPPYPCGAINEVVWSWLLHNHHWTLGWCLCSHLREHQQTSPFPTLFYKMSLHVISSQLYLWLQKFAQKPKYI